MVILLRRVRWYADMAQQITFAPEGKARKSTLQEASHQSMWGFYISALAKQPFRYALDFVQKALDLIPYGCKVAMFLRIQFLEGKARRKFFEEHPPQTVYVFTSRIKCAINGNFEATKGSAALYAWFVWEKGWKGETRVRWI